MRALEAAILAPGTRSGRPELLAAPDLLRSTKLQLFTPPAGTATTWAGWVITSVSCSRDRGTVRPRDRQRPSRADPTRFFQPHLDAPVRLPA